MSIELKIVRLEQSDQGTLGVLLINREIFCFTLEPPDRDNQANISSIPANRAYLCRPFTSEKFGHTFEITDVPNRSAVLFHAGNVVADTRGCVILGATVGKLKTWDRAVLNSGDTFKRFMSLVGKEHALTLFISKGY
jgi:hypothetical protein